ncbi:MAG: PadR family transcriptional regulator [archaeon]
MAKLDEKLKTVFSSINGSHVLFLYNSKMDKYATFASFLFQGKGNGKGYVSGDDPDFVLKQLRKFNLSNFKVSVIDPTKIDELVNYKRVAIDASSINLTPRVEKKRKRLGEDELIKEFLDNSKREDYINKNSAKSSVLCGYNIDKLSGKEIKNLILQHDNVILANNIETLSTKNLNHVRNVVNNELVTQSVKKELKTLVLALLVKSPKCGREIQTVIHKKFNLLISPGTLYPLLHNLTEEGLINCRVGIKTKTYNAFDGREIRKIINKHIQAKEFIGNFLQNTLKSELPPRRQLY